MNTKLSKAIKYFISLLLAVVLLYFSFRGVQWSDFWDALKACAWEYVILAMLAGVLSFYLRGLRWRELLLPIDPSTRRSVTFNAVNISYVVNMALPRVGEFVRCGYITANSARTASCDGSKERRLASYDKVLGTVAIERSADMVTMLLLLVIFLFLGWSRYGAFFSDNIIDPLIGRFGAKTVMLIALSVAVLCAAVVLIVKLGRKSRSAGRVSSFLKGIWQGISSCMKMKSAWKFFLINFGVWVCYWLMSYFTLLAIQGMDLGKVNAELAGAIGNLMNLNGIDALFLMLAGSIASVVPVPGGFGAFHYIVGLACSSVYGVPFQVGIIFATLSHESQAVTQMICGGVSYVVETLKKKQ